MHKVLFYLKNDLDFEINLSKIGLTFRNLNEDEYEDILQKFKSIILSGKSLKIARDYYLYKKDSNKFSVKEAVDLFTELEKSKYKKIIYLIYSSEEFDAFQMLNIKNIKRELKNVLIAEIDDEEFNKHFYREYIYSLIPKIIDFSNYISTDDGNYAKYENRVYNYEGTESTTDLTHTLLLNIAKDKNNCYFRKDFFQKLQQMFEMRDREFCFSFIMMIDSILSNDILAENRIVNKVSFLERLLISKDEKKSEGFILKVGILCNNLFEIKNDNLSKILKEIYDVRSLIVHGNINKIINNSKRYKEIFNLSDEFNYSKYWRAKGAFLNIEIYLNFFLIKVLNEYLHNPKLCEYIKKN